MPIVVMLNAACARALELTLHSILGSLKHSPVITPLLHLKTCFLKLISESLEVIGMVLVLDITPYESNLSSLIVLMHSALDENVFKDTFRSQFDSRNSCQHVLYLH